MLDIGSLLPERTAADSLRGLARFELGGQEMVLPTLSIDESERWVAGIEAETAGLLAGVETAGNDASAVIALLTTKTPTLLRLLKDYDRGDILPSIEEIRRTARPHEVLLAVVAIWRAANPLLDIALMGFAMSGTSSEPMSSPPPNGAGLANTSATTSPPSSSSATSTPPGTVTKMSTRRASTKSGPRRSSPTTRRPTIAGAPDGPSASPLATP